MFILLMNIGLIKMEEYMEIHVNRQERTVEWNYDGKIVNISNEHMLYAFKHGKDMLMIKEKYEVSGSGFSLYDITGKQIFSYKYLDNTIKYKENKIIKVQGNIISVDYQQVSNKLIVLREENDVRIIEIYEEKGNFIAQINAPRGYKFVSLKNDEGNIMVVAQGMNDITRDSFGRNDWNFAIDLENYYVEKKSIIQ